jgi:hypothetical protein
MNGTALRLLKAYLWFVAVFHLFVGLAVNFSPELTQAIAASYGARVDWTPQFVYILKPLGAFMIALGMLAGVAARDPIRYSAAVLVFVGLFVLRALHRVIFGDLATEAFGIDAGRNTTNLIIMLAQAALLYGLWHAARRPVIRPQTA